MNTTKFALAIATALAASGALQAQNFRPGAQLTLSIPENNRYQGLGLGSKPGYGFGLHGLIPLKDGHAIVPRLDVVKFDNKGSDSLLSAQVKTTTISIGADYQYHFGGDSTGAGLYVIGGARYSSNKQDITFTTNLFGTSVSDTQSQTVRDTGFLGGCGYMLTPHMGAEIRYSPSGLGYAGSTFDLSFVFRF